MSAARLPGRPGGRAEIEQTADRPRTASCQTLKSRRRVPGFGNGPLKHVAITDPSSSVEVQRQERYPTPSVVDGLSGVIDPVLCVLKTTGHSLMPVCFRA